MTGPNIWPVPRACKSTFCPIQPLPSVSARATKWPKWDSKTVHTSFNGFHMYVKDWSNVFMVTSICYSCGGRELNFQNPHGSSQLSVNPVPGHPTPFSDLRRLQVKTELVMATENTEFRKSTSLNVVTEQQRVEENSSCVSLLTQISANIL